MGLIRGAIGAGKAAARGASGTDIAKAGVKGLLPKKMGGIVDKVATPNNISRVSNGIRNVADNGRNSTFGTSTADDGWGDMPTFKPDAPSKSDNLDW
ncbi:hypothetical protein UFOVP965_73 [uncultured Caudovirales phage]|uniref:Uncharacterized protein n=1 Tax=uncultured Caudovirales phage TaxID=2100421 RepID=A0A6J5PZ58_9CAUD|nr:hypothetical protein UFOVP965_73 [uncultured Caudovirales phage]CAB4179827.1 hypothetical protein UFOVP1035_69 [uncultured Caudovirales phage]CAB4188499.1 hypothetical protein UFOVP1181_28 [uncultured Caudovirales phage]